MKIAGIVFDARDLTPHMIKDRLPEPTTENCDNITILLDKEQVNGKHTDAFLSYDDDSADGFISSNGWNCLLDGESIGEQDMHNGWQASLRQVEQHFELTLWRTRA